MKQTERTPKEKTNEIEAGDNSALENSTTDQRPFQRKRRRQLFCPDVIFESLLFLRLLDLLRASTINRRVLGGLCRRALDRLKPPRIIGPQRIDDTNEVVYREHQNGGQMVPFPVVPPPLDKILGFGPVKIDLHHGSVLRNAQILGEIGEFLRLSEKLLDQHDLLLDLERIRRFKNAAEVLDERILSQLTGGVRLIEMNLKWNGLPVLLLKSQTFRGTNRLLINDFGHIRISKRRFHDCADWLHSPTADGAPRALILRLGPDLYGNKDIFIPMIVKCFERNNNKGEPPKFCLIILIYGGEPQTELSPFHLTNGERGDALSLELIHEGRDRFGRPLSELFSIDPRIENLDNGGIPAVESFLRQMFNLNPHRSMPISATVNIYILRRDVAVGPWIRPELFMARCRDPVPEHQKLLHISLV